MICNIFRIIRSGKVRNQDLAALSRFRRRRFAVLGQVHVLIQCGGNLPAGGAGLGGKTALAPGSHHAVGPGPVHGGPGIGRDGGFVGVILTGGVRTARPAPENRGHLLACHWVAYAKTPVAVAVDVALLRRPANGFGIWGVRGHVGKPGPIPGGKGQDGQGKRQRQRQAQRGIFFDASHTCCLLFTFISQGFPPP